MELLIPTALLLERHSREGGSSLSPGVIAAIVTAVIVTAIGGRVVTHGLDRKRIDAYAAEQGWTLVSCTWKLLGPGWFGSKGTRIYAITYTDREGRTHEAFAKTSALSGVYLTEDRIVDGRAG